MKKFILISPKNRTVYNFRGDLIQEIKSNGYEVIVTGPNLDHLDKIEELGGRFIEIPINKNGLNPFADLRYLLELRKLMRLEKPDVTLGYTIKPVIYGAIAAKMAGVKCINSMITGVGYLFTSQSAKTKLLRFFVSFLYRLGLRVANVVIFQNPDDRNEFLKHQLVKREKCFVVNGSGVNMDKFTKTAFPDRITFFMLSRVMFSKGIREYLAAAEIVKKKYPDVRFMLLGAVEDIQDSLKREDLVPYIKDEIIDYYEETIDVRPYMEQCSVYVLPSYREGTPRTVLEAMAMGRPIITSDAPGCRETVENGKNGFLIPIKDVNALVEKIEWFIQNPEQIPVMGERSFELCKRKFEVSKVNKDMIKICCLNG
ncbi:glycosyltransferase family 4 protein [Parabacteroides goldsteinii]